MEVKVKRILFLCATVVFLTSVAFGQNAKGQNVQAAASAGEAIFKAQHTGTATNVYGVWK
jgi:hypothetical protein